MSYIKMLGFGFGGPLGLKKMAGGSSNSLFSTAVISGSSSAPNLRDMIPSTASASAIEGIGGVPPIRPLETLHNALSLRQLDYFLDKMTSAPLFRTPASSPPKYPSTPLPTPTASLSRTPSVAEQAAQAAGGAHPPPLKLQSPCNSWSGPPSFVSSSGPSSPAGLSDLCSKENSDMSTSIISSDGGMNVEALSHMFPAVAGLDQDLGSVGILLESEPDGHGSMEFSEFYSSATGRLHAQGGGSGDITPVSVGSEADFNTNDATAGSTADADVTMTEDLEISEEDVGHTTPLSESTVDRARPPPPPPPSADPGDTQSPADAPRLTGPGSDKWCTNKERFLDNRPGHSLISEVLEKSVADVSKNLNVDDARAKCEKAMSNELQVPKVSLGAVLVRESFIEPPRMSRISKSFHGKTSSSDCPSGGSAPRRASDSVSGLRSDDGAAVPGAAKHALRNVFPAPKSPRKSSDGAARPGKCVNAHRQFVTQLSQPCAGSAPANPAVRKASLNVDGPAAAGLGTRFTTTLVDEGEHAASVRAAAAAAAASAAFCPEPNPDPGPDPCPSPDTGPGPD